jgi:hypothetical protein
MTTASTAAADELEAILRTGEFEYTRPEPRTLGVSLPGVQRLKTTCWLSVGDHALSIEAFVVRKPDENAEAVHTWMLRRNARMYIVSWSVDDSGDIYLTGRLPLSAITEDELDRVLGAVLEYADSSFNYLLQLGFASAIRREWAWRVKNDQPLANLEAFRSFAVND